MTHQPPKDRIANKNLRAAQRSLVRSRDRLRRRTLAALRTAAITAETEREMDEAFDTADRRIRCGEKRLHFAFPGLSVECRTDRTWVGFTETDGSYWDPTFGDPCIQDEFRDAHFELITAPGKPLVGHKQGELPTRVWLGTYDDAFPELFVRDRCAPLAIPRKPLDVFVVLGDLFWAFKRIEMRLSDVFTKTNLDHAQRLAKKVSATAKLLEVPRTAQVYRDPSLDAFKRDCEKHKKRLDWIIDILQLETDSTEHRECHNREEFVRGPLSDAYDQLYGLRPPRRWTTQGPFMRFALTFFHLVGHPTKPSTIATALSGRAGSKRVRKRAL